MLLRTKKHFSESEIKEIRKNVNELEKNLKFKKFHGNIDSVNYEYLDNYDYNYDFTADDEYRKIGSIRTLFKEFASDYNNYIEYTSTGR